MSTEQWALLGVATLCITLCFWPRSTTLNIPIGFFRTYDRSIKVDWDLPETDIWRIRIERNGELLFEDKRNLRTGKKVFE